ncbi:MAG: hypothetical protein ACK456_14815 [Pseudanabaenaceae cyanobacterium]|jgi:hypothetical protein
MTTENNSFSAINSRGNLITWFSSRYTGLDTYDRTEVIAIVIANVTRRIANVVESSVTGVVVDFDINEANVRINRCLRIINQLYNKLSWRIEQGDDDLYDWVLDQLVILRRSLNNRQNLVKQLASFTDELWLKLHVNYTVSSGSMLSRTELE